MIYDVMLTDQAESDLRGIHEYIAFELLEPDYAQGQIDRLEKHILDLANFPKKYREYTVSTVIGEFKEYSFERSTVETMIETRIRSMEKTKGIN